MDLDTAKSLTLQQVTDAIGQVQIKLTDPSIASANRTALEHTLVALTFATTFGSALTTTLTVAVLLHPFPSVPVTV